MSTSTRIRICVVVMLSLLALFCLAQVNLAGPKERHPYDSFEFPRTIELASFQATRRVQSETPRLSGRVIAGASYDFPTTLGPLEVRTAYLANGDGDAYEYATNALELADLSGTPVEDFSGALLLRRSEDQYTLTACLLPEGRVVTSEDEMALILRQRPVTIHRVFSNTTGDRPWIDERHLWTSMTITIPAGSSDESVIELLGQIWSEWRTFWTEAFPD